MEKKTKKKKKSEKAHPVIFRAHWQRYMKPKLWTDLLIYLFSGPREDEEALDDFHKHKKCLAGYDIGISKPVYLKRGNEILIRPEMPCFRFNPSQATITLEEDQHKVKFGMQPLLKATRGERIYGQVSFFVGPLLICDIGINVTIKKRLSEDEEITTNIEASAPYRKIFVSCAREDLHITEITGKTYEPFGHKFMRDVKYLPHGEKWWPAICKLIKEADEFHLFWSKAAKKSKYVEMEWREALKQNKKNFIRPIYWEKPMPKPPPELEEIHFKYVKL